MRVSVSVELKNGKTIIIDTSPDLRVQALNNNMKNIDADQIMKLFYILIFLYV